MKELILRNVPLTPHYVYRDFRHHHNFDAFGINIHAVDEPIITEEASNPNLLSEILLQNGDVLHSETTTQVNGKIPNGNINEDGFLKPPQANGAPNGTPTVRSSR